MTRGRQGLLIQMSGVHASAAEPASSVTFTVPPSDAYPLDLYHARRGMIGGSWARGWIGFSQSGTVYTADISHGGSAADATADVASRSGSTRIAVTLPAGNRTGSQNASTLASALSSAGITGVTSDGDQLTIVGATAGTIPPAVDTTDRSLRGMFGIQRDDWGAGGATTLNGDGGTDGTGSVHLGTLSDRSSIPSSTDARILAAYIFGRGGYTPLLAAGTGPVHSTDPGAITVLVQGQVATALNNIGNSGGFGMVVFPPADIGTDDELWAIYRGSTATAPGGPRFRFHAATPAGTGDIPPTEQLVWDTTSPTSALTAVPASYNPTADSNFAIAVSIGVIFERRDASGNYHADGSIDDWHGDQNTDDDHGTQFAAGPTLIDPETTHHRFVRPNWSVAPVVQVRRAYDDVDLVGADREDCSFAFYDWPDLDLPSTTAATRVGPGDNMQGIVAQNAYTVATLPSPIDLGSLALGSDRTISLGWNYVTSDGSQLDVMVLPVFVDSSTGDGSYLDAWVDDPETWMDEIPGASGYTTSGVLRAPTSGANEYRTTNTDMPHDSWAQTWPTTFATDATDDSPPAIAMEAYRIQRPGVAVA